MGNRTSRFEANDTAETVASAFDLSDRQYLVTGANCGLGLETVRVLALRGARVVCCVRRTGEMATIVQQCGLTAEQQSRLRVEELDLSSLASVRALAERLRHDEALALDGLVLNAGVMMLPEYTPTADGLETQWQINHLSHFALSLALLPLLLRSPRPARVVSVSSRAHERAPRWHDAIVPPQQAGYSPIDNYALSKLSNVLFAAELQRRLPAHRLLAVSLHPGVIPTELGRNNTMADWFYRFPLTRAFMKSIPQGASTQVYCLLEDSARLTPGGYHADNDVAECTAAAASPDNAAHLWTVSMRLLEEKAPEIYAWIQSDHLISDRIQSSSSSSESSSSSSSESTTTTTTNETISST